MTQTLRPPTRFGPWIYRAIARLKPGVSPESAQAELALVGSNPTYKDAALPTLEIRNALLGVT